MDFDAAAKFDQRVPRSMNTFITLDYELFFGRNVGTVEKCLLQPTEKLLGILDASNVKATFFVDIGMLVRAEELNVWQDEARKVENHLKELAELGHDLQLHIHPHWERATYNNGWVFDHNFYKLADFSKVEAGKIVAKYADKLNRLRAGSGIARAFRAGGWCIQPFSHFSESLREAGITLDSTVYEGGYNPSEIQGFDFRQSPKANVWRFSDDPLIEKEDGHFLELPISSVAVWPTFYWGFVAARFLGSDAHKSLGDGSPTPISRLNLLRLLLLPTKTVASIDGYKASLLDSYRRQVARTFGAGSNLVLIGHPKAFTEFSLGKLSDYIEKTLEKDTFQTLDSWLESSAH